MGDKYESFRELATHEREGTDFQIRSRHTQSSTLIVAPHGGGIEPGTSEIADVVALEKYSFYAFEGLKPSGNATLHITSTRFDEPRCLSMISCSNRVLVVHGRDIDEPIVFLGERDFALMRTIARDLKDAGFATSERDEPEFQGVNPHNVCNRGSSGAGVQLEISVGLRRSMFKSLSSAGREIRSEMFFLFTNALRKAMG